jgi:uncharacterized protein (DUF2235 family)
MSKNIVICCDGTGNEYGENNSNVVKLFRALAKDPNQVAFYDPGVGTMSSPGAISWLAKKWTLLIGMAFGYGLSANISHAYTYLMNRYEPGDKIYLFGFSRGAYTVRALAGLLHARGLLEKGSENLIPYALKLFRQEKPDREEMCRGFKSTFSRDCDTYFIGVWDTVSSVGWILNPVKLPYTANNPSLKVIRHAISIDERRCFFRQNVFLDEHNGQDLKEVWFAGVHSDIGGGYPEAESGLSKITLQWMARESGTAGLIFDQDELDRVLGIGMPGQGDENFVKPDYAGKLHNSLTANWWILEFFPARRWRKINGQWVRKWTVPLGRSRVIPEGITVCQSVIDRKNNAACHYQPSNLPMAYNIEK